MVQSRLLAFIIDHLILSIVLMPIVLIVNFDSFFYPTAENASRPFETFYPILIAWLIVFYMKDFIGGRSIGKRIIRIGVRDYSDAQKTPGIMRLFLRNLFLLLWPIELILLLLTGKRLGDRLAKTTVVQMSRKGA